MVDGTPGGVPIGITDTRGTTEGTGTTAGGGGTDGTTGTDHGITVTATAGLISPIMSGPTTRSTINGTIITTPRATISRVIMAPLDMGLGTRDRIRERITRRMDVGWLDIMGPIPPAAMPLAAMRAAVITRLPDGTQGDTTEHIMTLDRRDRRALSLGAEQLFKG